MTDVIQIAQERRAQLRAEIQKLDEFLRMAEMLTRESGGADILPAPTASAMDRSMDSMEKANGTGGALRTNLFRQSGTGA